MPRKAPDNVTEHRITFGNLERAFLDQQQEQVKQTAIINAVGTIGPSLGILVIGGGVALAAYSFFKWAGLSDLPGKIKDTIVTTGGNATAAILGTTIEKQTDKILDPYVRRKEEIKERCRTVYNTQSAILASPNSSENQKAQANLAIQENIDRCSKQLHDLTMEVANREVTYSDVVADTWLGDLTGN